MIQYTRKEVIKMEETIAAISTSVGTGAISIVRLSGKEALSITNKLFHGPDLMKVDSHTIHYGFIKENENLIDEVLISVMLAPKTYTTEDIVEINCHGGIATTNKVLELLLKNGARLAEPGEFTKRAFLNGRIDLIEAESVSDLIMSKSDKQRTLALNGVNGRLGTIVKKIREILLNLIANIAVNIDYPEYEDAIEVTQDYLNKELDKIKNDLEILLKNASIGEIIRNGIDVALVGRPNVGKSSILNALLNEEKAIVTDISGTTRDVIEGKMNLNGIEINLIDTAGIREANDYVEKIGVDKSKEMIEKSDLVILVLNNNEKLNDDDLSLLEKVKEKTHILFINKNDLESHINLPEDKTVVYGNTMTLDGMEALKEKIIEMYQLDQIALKDLTYLSNARQIDLVSKSLKQIEEALLDIEKSIPIDMIEIHLRNAFDNLGKLIGECYEDELIDKLFKNFCLGK